MGLIALLACVATSDVLAGNLANSSSYANGDVLICFRKSGGANDMVVDAGPVSTFTNATINQRIPITQYTTNQLYLIGLNSLIFSAFTWYDTSTVSQDNALLFMSRGRSTLYSQTLAWAQQSAQFDSFCAGVLGTVASGAVICRNYNVASSDTAILEPDDSSGYNTTQNSAYTTGQSYIWALDPNNFNFQGNFPGNPEKTAPSTFITGGQVVRSDFYLVPATGFGSVKFFGYFELNTNGLMTYVAFPTTPTVTTLAASSLASTTAQLNASVNPNADAATMFFQYGLTTTYGNSSITTNLGTTSGTYALSVSNLVAGTTYHYRAAAYNRAGTNFGADLTFVTTAGGGVATPVINKIIRSSTAALVSFTTGNSGTYTLRGTNSAGLNTARTNWPAIASVGGNGLTNTLQDTTSAASKFYLITAQ